MAAMSEISVSMMDECLSSKAPFVTIVIPCRNEEKYIARCLDSILKNDYPWDRAEILIVDGESVDRTRTIVAGYVVQYPFIKMVENPKRSIPAAMNISIEHARGDILVKIDAHSTYLPNHIRDCVKYQGQSGAENVGGVLEIKPGACSGVARAITVALATRFGSGNALIKTRVNEPTWSDAVAFGCYRKTFLREIGGFNEDLTGSSDMDLNYRIRAKGGRILLIPEVVVQYVADATLKALWTHNFADGVWATYVLKFRSRAWSWRHWIPMAFVANLIISFLFSFVNPLFLYLFLAIAAVYGAVNVAVSVFHSVRERDWRMMFLLPLVFGVRHFAHGIGALYGLLLASLPGVHWKGRRNARG